MAADYGLNGTSTPSTPTSHPSLPLQSPHSAEAWQHQQHQQQHQQHQSQQQHHSSHQQPHTPTPGTHHPYAAAAPPQQPWPGSSHAPSAASASAGHGYSPYANQHSHPQSSHAGYQQSQLEPPHAQPPASSAAAAAQPSSHHPGGPPGPPSSVSGSGAPAPPAARQPSRKWSSLQEQHFQDKRRPGRPAPRAAAAQRGQRRPVSRSVPPAVRHLPHDRSHPSRALQRLRQGRHQGGLPRSLRQMPGCGRQSGAGQRARTVSASRSRQQQRQRLRPDLRYQRRRRQRLPCGAVRQRGCQRRQQEEEAQRSERHCLLLYALRAALPAPSHILSSRAMVRLLLQRKTRRTAVQRRRS